MPPPPGSRRSAVQRSLWKGATRSTEVETSTEGFSVKVTMSAILFPSNTNGEHGLRSEPRQSSYVKHPAGEQINPRRQFPGAFRRGLLSPHRQHQPGVFLRLARGAIISRDVPVVGRRASLDGSKALRIEVLERMTDIDLVRERAFEIGAIFRPGAPRQSAHAAIDSRHQGRKLARRRPLCGLIDRAGPYPWILLQTDDPPGWFVLWGDRACWIADDL